MNITHYRRTQIKELLRHGYTPTQTAEICKLHINTIRRVAGIEILPKNTIISGNGLLLTPEQHRRYLQLKACIKVALENGIKQPGEARPGGGLRDFLRRGF